MGLELEVTPLIDGCIPAAGVACLKARPSIGESAVAVDLACRIVSGATTLGGAAH